ncbi:hypothetical protein [Rhizobium sp. FKL33]|uniref:hypothetical protein n=1 Tax=Rhizobium sp. FKL33 TaxID=2562307 RepID=UPI001484E102|nr:hypothetical protein [Rhizobium sp. FKL33]
MKPLFKISPGVGTFLFSLSQQQTLATDFDAAQRRLHVKDIAGNPSFTITISDRAVH